MQCGAGLVQTPHAAWVRTIGVLGKRSIKENLATRKAVLNVESNFTCIKRRASRLLRVAC
jgi:hypothetical protein